MPGRQETPLSEAQSRVDRAYRHLVNTQYDASTGYANIEELRRAEHCYHDALDRRDALKEGR